MRLTKSNGEKETKGDKREDCDYSYKKGKKKKKRKGNTQSEKRKYMENVKNVFMGLSEIII